MCEAKVVSAFIQGPPFPPLDPHLGLSREMVHASLAALTHALRTVCVAGTSVDEDT